MYHLDFLVKTNLDQNQLMDEFLAWAEALGLVVAGTVTEMAPEAGDGSENA